MTFLAIAIGSIFAGMFGAMLGLGGGIILIPMLTLGFGVDIRIAVATSLVAVIATSTGGAIAYIKSERANMRLGMTLEIATSIGAIIAGSTIAFISREYLSLLFIAILTYTAVHMLIGAIKHVNREEENDTEENIKGYKIKNMPLGMTTHLFAGMFSGYLGIGGGVITVPTLRLVMGVPMKSAIATSNFMLGVTAATGAVIYFARGTISTEITAAVITSVFIGAFFGAKISARVKSKILSIIFVALMIITAIKMVWELF